VAKWIESNRMRVAHVASGEVMCDTTRLPACMTVHQRTGLCMVYEREREREGHTYEHA